jgi:hypothetical protein
MVTHKLDRAIGEKLLALIREAFDKVEREDGISLHEADVIDDYGGELARRKARRLDNETHWSAVKDEDIERYHWVYSYFDAKGFRYYLPAVMSWAIHGLSKRDFDSTSLGSLLYCLTPRKKVGDDLFEYHVSLLNQQQKDVVRLFLWWLVDSYHDEEAFDALDRYWERTADERV